MKRRNFITLLWLLMVSQSTSAWAQEARCDSANFIKQQGRCLYFICRKGLQPLHYPKLV
jgi:hypothetical protein